MARKIGLKAAEYEQLTTSLKTAHETYLDEITALLDRIEQLNQRGGAFHLDALSPRIQGFIDQVRTAKSTMETVYSAHEAVIESFQNGIENIDITL